jgi:hypothetical protein
MWVETLRLACARLSIVREIAHMAVKAKVARDLPRNLSIGDKPMTVAVKISGEIELRSM